MSDAYTFVKRRRTGNASAKLVLIAIAEYTDENGFSQPSSVRLKEDTELSARTISSALDALEEKGVIRRYRTYAEGGKRAPDRIELIGFAEWRDSLSLHANSASNDYVQNLHVQHMHVQVDPQNLAPRAAESPLAGLDAKYARARRQKENSPTPPIRKTTPPEPKGSSGVETLPGLILPSAPRKLSSRAGRRAYPPDFEEFWSIWPANRRKLSDKPRAAARFRDGAARFGAEAIMAAARAYLASADVRKENFRYCRLAEVFLNGGLEAAIESVTSSAPPREIWSSEQGGWVLES